MRAPEAVALLGDGVAGGLRPRGRAQLEQETLAAVRRADDAVQAVTAVRGVRRRELFRRPPRTSSAPTAPRPGPSRPTRARWWTWSAAPCPT
ncbi:hypothetical protein SVIOM342S_05682 [Streptomyces violaceorubidus]